MAKKVKKHFFKILPLSIAIMMIFAISIGVWQGLPVDDVRAADDYGVTGGDVGSFPIVGAASVTLNTITITESTADDFQADPETLTIQIDSANYPAVVFDQTVTSLTIAGTCGYTGHNAVTYTDDYTITVPVTGGTSCGDAETITVADLKVETMYELAAPGAVGLINVDSSTSVGSPVTSTSTVNLSVTAADAAMSVVLASPTVGTTGNGTLTLTVPVDMANGDDVEFDMPVNVDISSVAYVSTTFGGGGAFTCADTGGPTVTCTATGVITAGTGTIVMSGFKPIYAATGQTLGSGYVVDNIAGGENTAVDTTAGSVTDTTAADAAMALVLASPTVGTTGNGTLTVTVPVDMASGDLIDFDVPSNLDIQFVAYVSTTFAGGGAFTCADAGPPTVTCTATGTITANTADIVMSGFKPRYVATSQTLGAGYVVDNSASANTATDVTAGPVTDITAADAAASLALAGNSVVGATGDSTLTITVPVDMENTDTIAFDAPANLDVSSVAFSSETFAGAGTFSSCGVAGQTVTCTANGAITAGTGTIVMSGITSLYEDTGQTITSIVIYDTGNTANTATDASGTVTDTTVADAAASLALSTNSVVGVTGDSTLTLTIPVDLANNDAIDFDVPVNLDISAVAFSSDTFGGAGSFSCTDVSAVRVTCTANGVITAGTGTIVMSGIISLYEASGQTITSIWVYKPSYDMAYDASGSVTDTTVGNLTVTNVEPITLIDSATGLSTITFTTSSGIPTNGKIKITYGAGYDVSGATGGTCSSMDGTFSTGISGQTVTITRLNNGSLEIPGAQTCTVGGIVNPTTGSTGTYTILTTTTSDASMEQATVGADTIVDFIATATTDDSDGNGQIDLIVLALNADVAAASVAGTDFTLSGGYSITSASETNPSEITIVVTEIGSSDTAATPTVTVVSSIGLTAGGDVSSGSKLSVDGAAPALLSFTSSTGDATYGPTSGINITATYSENITGGAVAVTLNNPAATAVVINIIPGGTTIYQTYTVGATGSNEDVTGLDVATITGQSATDGTNANNTTTMPSTTIITASSINVDTTAPAAPTIPDLDAASDLGSLATDNITSDATPQFNVTAEAGSSVVVTSDLDATIGTLGTATGGSDAIATTITTTAGQTGTAHNISATATDAYGNIGPASGTLAVTIDVTAPTPVLGGTNNSYYNVVNDGTIGGVDLKFIEAVTLTYDDADWTAVPNGLTGFDVTGYSAGNGTTDITLNATSSVTGVGAGTEPDLQFTGLGTGSIEDVAGNTAGTYTATSLHDYADPQVVSVTPANAAGSASSTASVIINFTEGMDNTTLVISDDDTNPGSMTLPATWTNGNATATVSHVAWTTGALVTVTATADDPSGSSLRDSAGATPYVWSFTIATPSRGGGGGGGDINPPAAPTNVDLTADSTGTVTITWTDSISSDFSAIVLQRDHNPIVGTIVDSIYKTVPKDTETYTETDLIVGETYLYRVRAKDTSGNLSTNMETYSITIPTEEGVITEEEVIAPPVTEEDVIDPKLILEDPSPAGDLPDGVEVGQLVKRADMEAVYFIDQDNRRHAFPNKAIFLSWFPDFDDVQTISSETLAAIPLGSNVTMRPGTNLIKITSDPKVYAVEPYGVIRWVKTESIASALYGANWANNVVDVDVSFFINYQVGSAVSLSVHPTGSLMAYIGENSVYYIDQAIKRYVTSEAFIENLFQNRFVNREIDSSISYPVGADLEILPIEDLMMIK